MAGCDPFDALRLPTEHLANELYRRPSPDSAAIFELIQKDEYMPEVGLTNSTFTIERSEPTSDEETWNQIGSIGASGESPFGDPGSNPATSACSNTWNDVQYGFTERLYSPEAFDLRGPVICKDELIFNHMPARFLEAYMEALSKRSHRSIANRYLNIYMHLTPKNSATSSYTTIDGGSFVAGNTAPTSPDLSGLAIPTSQLTQPMLDQTAQELILEGATNANTPDWITPGPNGPVFPIWISMNMSQNIVLNNADFRQDYRYAEPSTLLRRLGAGVVVKNFRHVINLTPPRAIPIGGKLVRVPTWNMATKTKGKGAELTAQYLGAEYEAAIVLNPWVFRSEVIRPVNAAAGMSWEAGSYFGEWVFETGGERIVSAAEGGPCYDPTHKLGRHFGQYKHAARPIFPKFGRTIWYKICGNTNFGLVTCDTLS